MLNGGAAWIAILFPIGQKLYVAKRPLALGVRRDMDVEMKKPSNTRVRRAS